MKMIKRCLLSLALMYACVLNAENDVRKTIEELPCTCSEGIIYIELEEQFLFDSLQIAIFDYLHSKIQSRVYEDAKKTLSDKDIVYYTGLASQLDVRYNALVKKVNEHLHGCRNNVVFMSIWEVPGPRETEALIQLERELELEDVLKTGNIEEIKLKINSIHEKLLALLDQAEAKLVKLETSYPQLFSKAPECHPDVN